MRLAALMCTNNQDFRFALRWSEIPSLYEFVGAVIKTPGKCKCVKRTKGYRNGLKLTCNSGVLLYFGIVFLFYHA